MRGHADVSVAVAICWRDERPRRGPLAIAVGSRAEPRAHVEVRGREDAMPARRRHVVGPEVDRDYEVTAPGTTTRSDEGSQRLHRHHHQHRHYPQRRRDDDDTSGGGPLSGATDVGDNAKRTRDTDTATATMTSRDRTNEFANAIRSMQSRTAARTAVTLQNPRRARQLQSYSNFMMIAKSIGKNIASTYAKLEKLALCKTLELLARWYHLFCFYTRIKYNLLQCVISEYNNIKIICVVDAVKIFCNNIDIICCSGQEEIHIQRQTNGNRGAYKYYKNGFKEFECPNWKIARTWKIPKRKLWLLSKSSHRIAFFFDRDGTTIEISKYVQSL